MLFNCARVAGCNKKSENVRPPLINSSTTKGSAQICFWIPDGNLDQWRNPILTALPMPKNQVQKNLKKLNIKRQILRLYSLLKPLFQSEAVYFSKETRIYFFSQLNAAFENVPINHWHLPFSVSKLPNVKYLV